MSARELTWAVLQTLPEDQQAAYWRGLLTRWERNAERERASDFARDHARRPSVLYPHCLEFQEARRLGIDPDWQE